MNMKTNVGLAQKVNDFKWKQEKATEKKTENGSLRWSVKACIWMEDGTDGNELALKIGNRTRAMETTILMILINKLISVNMF